MSAPAGTDFDQISLSSSCEIVEGVEEAVQEHPLAQLEAGYFLWTHGPLKHRRAERQLPHPLPFTLFSVQAAHTNLYPHLADMDLAEEVVFTCMQDSFIMNRDLVVQFKYRDNTMMGGCYGDRVGLYKVPNTQPHQFLAYVWVSRGGGVATLDMSVLPEEEGEYLLQYILGDNTVVGTSTTFQMVRDVGSGVKELTPMSKENDTENNTVDVEDKSEVPVINEKRCQEVEAVHAAYAEEVKILTTRLSDEEVRCGKLFEENRKLSKEKEEMSRILETELERRAKLLDEKAEQVDKLEEFSSQIIDANKDRDLAVKELRALIQQQDTLRKELEEYREETGNAEAALVGIKQEMAQINIRINKGNSESFEDKIKDLAGNIEIHKKFLDEANGKVEDLEKEKGEINEEKVELELKLKEFVTMNKSMREAAEMLEHENRELRQRLDNISDVNVKNHKDIKYRSKICSLEEQVKVLNQQLMEARLSSNPQLVKFVKTAPEKQARSDGESLDESRKTALGGGKGDHVQEQNNPEKIRINQVQAQTSSSPSLFKEFPPASVPVDPTPPLSQELPAPSAPELPKPAFPPVLPTVSLECPFCGDFFPSNQKVELESHVEQHMEGMLECPICNLTFESGFQSLFETHVELHFKSQDHELEELPLDARGWDLGID